jgi:polar amino acid transport system substrate-binding protein
MDLHGSPTSWTRRAALLLAAALVAVAAGCGDSKDDAADASAAQACTPTATIPTLKDGVLQVVGPEYPPLFTYEGGKAGGVDGDILTAIAKRTCLDLDVKIQPAAGVIPSVQSGRADLAAGGWYISPERAKIIAQTAPDYADPPVLVSKDGAADIAAFDGKKIGTTEGYLWVDDLKKLAGDKAKLYQSPDAVFADVRNGRLDVGLMAVNEASYRLAQTPDSGLKMAVMTPTDAIAASQRPSVTNFPHTKDNAEMTKALNAEIAHLRDSGALEKILVKYGIDGQAAYPTGG